MNAKLFLGALIVVGVSLPSVGCKKTLVSVGGSGGSTTAAGTTTKSSTGTANTTSTKAAGPTTTATGGQTTTGGMGTCTMPQAGSDCTSCTDQNSCLMCESKAHQAGVAAYNALLDCVFCKACSTVLQATAADCPMGLPTTKDACDMGTAGDMTAIQNCEKCSAMGTCKTEVTSCTGNNDCSALLQEIPNNCGNLPAGGTTSTGAGG